MITAFTDFNGDDLASINVAGPPANPNQGFQSIKVN